MQCIKYYETISTGLTSKIETTNFVLVTIEELKHLLKNQYVEEWGYNKYVSIVREKIIEELANIRA